MPIVKPAPALGFSEMAVFITYQIGKVFLNEGRSMGTSNPVPVPRGSGSGSHALQKKICKPLNNPPTAIVYRKKKHVKSVNITFSKLIKLDNRQWEVNFRKLPSMPYQFHADTATLQGERIQFNIYRDGTSGWKISGRDLPMFFTDQCEKLGVAIEKGLEEYYPGYSE